MTSPTLSPIHEAFVKSMGCEPDSAPITWQGFKNGYEEGHHEGWAKASEFTLNDIASTTQVTGDKWYDENYVECSYSDFMKIWKAARGNTND